MILRFVFLIVSCKEDKTDQGKGYPYQGGVLIPPVQNLSSAVGSDSVSEVEGDLYAGSSEHFSPCRNPDDGDLFRTRHGEQACLLYTSPSPRD